MRKIVRFKEPVRPNPRHKSYSVHRWPLVAATVRRLDRLTESLYQAVIRLSSRKSKLIPGFRRRVIEDTRPALARLGGHGCFPDPQALFGRS